MKSKALNLIFMACAAIIGGVESSKTVDKNEVFTKSIDEDSLLQVHTIEADSQAMQELGNAAQSKATGRWNPWTPLNRLIGAKEIGVLVVGLAGAGKETLMKKLELGEVVQSMPAAGFEVAELEYKNIKFTSFDTGIHLRKIHYVWRNYYTSTKAVIYVVDSADHEHIEAAEQDLYYILTEDRFRDVNLLVFANKQDLPNAMATRELVGKLGLQRFHQRWDIQACSATTGDGLYDGLDWVVTMLSSRK